jgi:hypothetical protein
MSNRIDFVVQKYRLSELTFIDAELNGKKLGHGRIMSDDCLQRFVLADPSKDNKYLDWMVFMAGGGQEAMDKSIQLWKGESPDDPNSLRNLCYKDFMAEQVQGYTDDKGVSHKPVSKAEAEENWQKAEPRCYFEFLMGDQDIAVEDGYGFFREWPGKDGLYDRIVNVVQLWHNAQPKLLNQNKAIARAEALRSAPNNSWSADDAQFMAKWADNPSRELVELDLYAKWKPKEYSQKDATYNTLQAVLNKLSDIRRLQILKDDRHELIYEDAVVKVLCPLTVGSSLKYGSSKWCISNRSEFDRSIDGNNYGTGHNWKNYTSKGPLVFLLFKVPMPIWCSKMAIHIPSSDLCQLERQIKKLAWFDVQNAPSTHYTYSTMVERVREEHVAAYSITGLSADEKALALAGRACERAWRNQHDALRVEEALDKAVAHVVAWGLKFDTKKVVVDYLTDLSGPVIK